MNTNIWKDFQICISVPLKMGRMDEEQAVFEQLTLSDLEKWSSTALKTFNN